MTDVLRIRDGRYKAAASGIAQVTRYDFDRHCGLVVADAVTKDGEKIRLELPPDADFWGLSRLMDWVRRHAC